MRLDKFIWSVRLTKTRSVATDACNGGKIKLNTTQAKASKEVKAGDQIELKKGIITRRYQILALPNGRVGAKLVELYLKDITPETEILKWEKSRLVSVVTRDPGSGRPTKKERREIDEFLDFDEEGLEPEA